MNFWESSYVFLRLHRAYYLLEHSFKKLSQQYCESFLVKKKRVDKLIYELELLLLTWQNSFDNFYRTIKIDLEQERSLKEISFESINIDRNEIRHVEVSILWNREADCHSHTLLRAWLSNQEVFNYIKWVRCRV